MGNTEGVTIYQQAGADNLIGPAGQQLARLQALWELALDRQTPARQIEGLLPEAQSALQCHYAELWDERGQRRIAHTGDERARTLGPLVAGETTRGTHAMLVLGRFTVVRRFEAEQEPYVLSFAWDQRHTHTIGDTEEQYVDFLAHVLSRLLVLADEHRELQDRVSIDPLTGLQNRASTLERIEHRVALAKRTPSPFAVLYLDLNGFKQINDSHGHAFGDLAIAEAARRMRSVLRHHELAGRIGGDEFAVLVDYDETPDLEAVARRLVDVVSAPMTFDGVQVTLSASVGIALSPAHGSTAGELLAHADAAMYSAKRGARPQYAFYDPAKRMTTGTIRTVPRQSSAPAPFAFCFQPIVEARTGRVVSAEALIRWFDPVRGLLSLAGDETLEMPKHIDRAVVERLVSGDYLQLSRMLPIHVNVMEADDDMLACFPDDSSGIALEVPESLVAAEPERYGKFIADARKRGVRVGLTDFGGAGLPLHLLAELRLDFVKIGREFVPRGGGGSAAATRAAIAQAHHFGWSVIAENVEDEAQREWLVSAGVDSLQGYHICSPLTYRDFGNWLAHRTAK